VAALHLALAEESKLDGSPEYHLEASVEEEPEWETRTVLYRVAQEALANIRKHAQAARVEVYLGEQNGGYLMRIRDNGHGFDVATRSPSPEGHIGLTAMRECAEMASS